MIVFTTGNAAPWSSRGPGQNLFTSSYVALNATTGQIKWWYQVVHHDIWDYDCPAPTVQFDITIGGVSQAIAEPCKTGWVYELDRTTGAPLIGINEVKVPQSKAQNTSPTQPKPVGQPFSAQCAQKKTYTGKFANIGGHPVKVGCIFGPYDTTHAAAFGPSAQGGNDWNPSSYNPATHDLYVCAADSDFSLLGVPPRSSRAAISPGRLSSESRSGRSSSIGFRDRDGYDHEQDRLDSRVPQPSYGGLHDRRQRCVRRAGDGEYEAFDATTGQQLRAQARRGVAAPGMTYSVNGRSTSPSTREERRSRSRPSRPIRSRTATASTRSSCRPRRKKR